MKSLLRKAVADKRKQWDREATIAAASAIQSGKSARLVVYPTGLQTMRFAEPFAECGMHYEVDPEIWESLKQTGGKITWMN